jgi:hypothetical protein
MEKEGSISHRLRQSFAQNALKNRSNPSVILIKLNRASPPRLLKAIVKKERLKPIPAKKSAAIIAGKTRWRK